MADVLEFDWKRDDMKKKEIRSLCKTADEFHMMLHPSYFSPGKTVFRTKVTKSYVTDLMKHMDNEDLPEVWKIKDKESYLLFPRWLVGGDDV